MPRRLCTTALATAVLALGACGADDETGGGSGRDFGEDAATVTTNPTPSLEEQRGADVVRIGISERRFEPDEVTVEVGQRILWTNEEDVAHDVTATDGADFESDTLRKDQSFEYTPTKAGVIRYVCTIHDGQRGTITVSKQR